MNNKLLIGLVVVVSLVTSVVGAKYLGPALGGDFAGGVQPSNVFNASFSGGVGYGYVTPFDGLAVMPTGGLGAGGQSANNGVTELWTATEAYPATAFNLGAITNATSATSTAFSFTAPGFAVGDACEVSYNGATTTSAFGADAFVTAASGNAATVTVTFWNGASTPIAFTVTSTVTGASSTLKATCFHPGV